ncbi:MAG: SpoIIIAH-like family protein [Christensenellales bacterium]|jgi:stage III sporulation protein AH
MNSKKRVAVFAGLIVLLVLAGYLNFKFNNPDDMDRSAGVGKSSQVSSDNLNDDDAAEQTGAGFFSDFRKDRESVRLKEIEYIEGIISNDSSGDETVKEAQSQMLTITSAMDQEVRIEGLIKAKGFNDVVVTIGKGSINVVLDAAEITTQQAAQILDIVISETGESSENIKILPRN